MEFIGLKEKHDNICFGSTSERPLFPIQIAHDRFGNEMNPKKGVKEVGPGQYDDDKITTFTNFTKKISSKGYMLGARTEKRSFSPIQTDAPPLTLYQPSNTLVESPKRAFKPFDAGDTRFKHDNLEVTPGPGTYEFDVIRNRNVAMAYSFGGRAQMIPAVQIKCRVDNSEQCQICKEKIVGDYYLFKSQILCSKCYQKTLKWEDPFLLNDPIYWRNKPTNFKKTRDCDFIHEHQGTKAAIQKISDKELRKLKRKEAYLSLYWP